MAEDVWRSPDEPAGTPPAYAPPAPVPPAPPQVHPGTPPAHGSPPGYGWPPPYGYQPYPGYGPTPYAPGPGRTSGMAIASLVCSLVWFAWFGSLLGVIFGHVALAGIRRSPGVQGRGLAIAGLVVGYAALALLAVVLVAAAVAPSTPSI